MLMKADIMLLDEPTNHLDVTNVKWLQVWPLCAVLCGGETGLL
jgi:ATPase subunit of ABC transporter with duplicated ATPase domains